MDLSRRDLLTASAVLLMRPEGFVSAATSARRAGAATTQTGAEPHPIVLCWNENPYGPSPAARAALRAAVVDGCRYPDDEDAALLTLLTQKEHVDSNCIVTGTGSGELLRAMGMLCGRVNGEIVAAEPTYNELTRYAEQAGAKLKGVPVDKDLRHDLSAMHAAVSDNTRAVYICNPNNPTGTTLDSDKIASFVASMPDHVTTIVDEAYLDFANGVRSAVSLTSGAKRVVVLRTFSKIHGMAGVRCGYAVARQDVAAELAAARMTTPNIFASRAARASLSDHAFLTDCRQRIVASRNRITSELRSLGLAYGEPQGNFVFFDTGAPLAQFTDFMKQRNILVGRRFPPYENWCRITIGTEPQVDAFLEGLRAFKASAQKAA